jgi:predicted Zn-dependent protease
MDLFAYFYLTDQDNGEWQRASAVLDYIRDRAKGESLGEYWEDRGLIAEMRLQPLEAIEAYDRAIALGAQPLPLIRKAAALADLDRDPEAVESLNAVARIPYLTANDWQVIAQVYHQLNLPEDMLEAGLRCAKLEPAYPMCAIQISEALRMLHRYEASLEALRPVANTNPLVWHYVQISRVDALTRVGDFREATRITSDLTTKYPDDLSLRYSHAQMLLIMSRGAEAASLFHTVNARYPTADGLCAEARARLAAGERDGIEALIQSGRKQRANSPVCGLAAGEWETMRGRHDQAEVEFRAAVALDRNDPLLVRKWASALVALGQKDLAQQKEAVANDLERRNREWKLSTH